jgi:FkbM family methyltransferase
MQSIASSKLQSHRSSQLPGKFDFVFSLVKRLIGVVLNSQPLAWLIKLVLNQSIRSGGFCFQIPESMQAGPWVALLTGQYERAEIRLIQRHLPRDIDCIELGVSIGVTSCHIRRLLDPGKILLSVEAKPELSRYAEKNLSQNFSEGGWEVIHAAVFYGNESPWMSPGSGSLEGALTSEGASGEACRVPGITLSSLAGRLGDREFSLVADIEGAEFDLVKNDIATFAKCRVAIIELHGSDEAKQEFVTRMQSIGMKVLASVESVWAFSRSIAGDA